MNSFTFKILKIRIKTKIKFLLEDRGISDKTTIELKVPQKLQRGFPGGASGKESTGQCRKHGFNSWVRRIPWSRKWQPL